MPQKTSYADLSIYDGTTDADKNFRDFRVDIAGIGSKSGNTDTRSNFQKIDDILGEHVPNKASHRKIYDISAIKDELSQESGDTYIATGVEEFNALENGMIFIVSFSITNSETPVYLQINNTDNVEIVQKYNSTGVLEDIGIGDIIPNAKYIIEYDYLQGRFIILEETTPQEILDNLKKVDGAGSGLDADLLDGKHGNEYATAAQGAKADSSIQHLYRIDGSELMPSAEGGIGLHYNDVGATPITRTVNGKALTGDITLYIMGNGNPPSAESTQADIYFKYS